MTINDYKTALKNIIDATNDEQLLKHWKTHLEWESQQMGQRDATQPQQTSSTEKTANARKDKDDDEGYVILESGLGIDE